MSAFEKEGGNLQKKIKLSDRDYHQTLMLIVRKEPKRIAPHITTEFNDRLKDTVSIQKVFTASCIKPDIMGKLQSEASLFQKYILQSV